MCRLLVSHTIQPSYLEYGRELRLPSDLVMNGQQTSKNNSHTEYATELKKRLAKAFECSRETLESSHRTQKHYYDRWARGIVYKEGDLVMWKDQKTRNGRCKSEAEQTMDGPMESY